ncbi:MAG TPA: Hpt domain-containing protein [Armatimonadota bacterium]|nr:Hpt domain-containing protein [Armatimonadota bacterium]HOM71208.1 Hpt domain-containing protein [Armatimonadota bacterium]HOP79385.1 Hpt domain-containing protein [Armatimonadota bacterium]
MNKKEIDINTDWLIDVRRTYLSGASRKLAELERAIAGLEQNPTSVLHERRLRRLLHNLIGSGASYGFPAVTDTARGMSECLKRRREGQLSVDTEVLTNLRAYLARLRRIFYDARA